MLIQKHSCIPIFIAALFTFAKIWKQPKCPSTNECVCVHTHTHIRVHIYIHNGLLVSHKEDKILPFAAPWMLLEVITLSGKSQKKTTNI